MEYQLVDNNVRVVLHDSTNEGWGGDYDSSDPDDQLLLRFDVDERIDNSDSWQPIDDASYCTALPASTPKDLLNKALEIIMSEVKEAVEKGYSIKKTCECLSWINPSWLMDSKL
jgi:hypothetical protein